MRLPYPELSRDHQRALEVVWRERAESGSWPPSREWVRFHAEISGRSLDRAFELWLLDDQHSPNAGVRVSVLGLAYLDDEHARRALALLDRLFTYGRERYRPGLRAIRWVTVAEALDLDAADEELAATYGPDLGLIQGDSQRGLELRIDERLASRSLEAALFGLVSPSTSVFPVSGPSPLDVRLSAVEVSGFRALRNVRVELAPLTVVIGLNGVGKSTLLDAVAFMATALCDGLGAAIHGEAGIERLRTRGDEAPIIIALGLEIDLGDGAREAEYRVELGAVGDGPTQKVVVEQELLWLQGKSGAEPLIDRRRAVANVRRGDGSTDELYVSVSELVLATLADERRYPVALGVRQALGRTLLIDRDPVDRDRSEWSEVGPDDERRRRKRAVTSLARLLHEAIPDDESAERLAGALRAFVPSVTGVVRQPQTGGLTEIDLIEEGSSEPGRFDELSAGVRQMLLLTALYVHRSPPPVVLLEEPDAALHAGAIPALRDLLRALGGRTTVIATSHRVELVGELDANEEVRVLERSGGEVRARSLADARTDRRWLRAFDPAEALARFGLEHRH